MLKAQHHWHACSSSRCPAQHTVLTRRQLRHCCTYHVTASIWPACCWLSGSDYDCAASLPYNASHAREDTRLLFKPPQLPLGLACLAVILPTAAPPVCVLLSTQQHHSELPIAHCPQRMTQQGRTATVRMRVLYKRVTQRRLPQCTLLPAKPASTQPHRTSLQQEIWFPHRRRR